jgi:hypothetical protein
MAFSFGNLSGRGGFFGNCPILSMWFGNQKFYPAGSGDYINLPGTGGTIGYAANYATISNITASTNNWTVESSDTSWLTVTKTSNTQVRYNVTENGITERTGYLYFKIGDTTYATYQVRQMAAELYITVSPTFVNLQNGLATGGTIAVTSNTTAWTVSTVSAGFTAEKYLIGSTYVVRWQVTENTTGAQRIGYISVSYGSVTATTQINQSDSIYVFSGLTTNPMTIGSGQTTFSISLVSKFGQAITEQPSVSIGYNPAMNVQLTSTASGGTQGQWNFVFSCNANDTESQRTTSIVFTQPGSQNTLTYVVHQQKKYVPETIDGFLVFATYGDWQVGKYLTTTTDIGGVPTPIYAAAILRTTPVTTSCVANFTMNYYTRTPQQQGQTDATATGPRTIATTSTVSIPNGDTAYGITITGGPNLTITSVTDFSVS